MSFPVHVDIFRHPMWNWLKNVCEKCVPSVWRSVWSCVKVSPMKCVTECGKMCKALKMSEMVSRKPTYQDLTSTLKDFSNFLPERVSEWVSKWVSESVSEWVRTPTCTASTLPKAIPKPWWHPKHFWTYFRNTIRTHKRWSFIPTGFIFSYLLCCNFGFFVQNGFSIDLATIYFN